MLLVVALAVTLTILVTRDGSGGSSPTPPGDGQASEFASANDTGPVNIITEDPTCDAWGKVAREFVDKTKAVGWEKRDPQLPASAWTSDQRSMYEAVGDAMSRAADQAANLARSTPHRVMRELYQQFIAYSAAFVSTIPEYDEPDRHLAFTTDSLVTATANICSAIDYDSAAAIAPLLSTPSPPTATAPIGDPASPTRFLERVNPVCEKWGDMVIRFGDETADWVALDPAVPASDWSLEQQRINEDAARVMDANADELVKLGQESENAVLGDFASLGAQYRRGFAEAIPTYDPNDNFLAQSATFLVRVVDSACKATQ
ncbi:hypothetical protein [Mycobacterium sp. IS-1742]|uniref:hypothetical protein n=1 Tax=Mycobacterium sp. IS-1742 TaxID=1772285 RepID=UPI001E2C0072|nr:hypothetical protein [Mycobacterium sp. IS-1742]